ncbi:MAG TPA: protein kinase, partial [Kofleriaceae bacterium]
HNVLCGKAGRIVVTDFGLARDAEGAVVPDPLAVTMPVGTATTTTGQSSPLSGLTVEGSLLGTPAYMAPEQWAGGTVTPATDQFAYCVALWEALTGERPYKGPTVEDLKIQVARGPEALDASKIPRRLRDTLRRGLDPDPAKRWPSMDALLAKIERGKRRPGLAIGVGGVVAIGAVVGVLAMQNRDVPAVAAVGCDPPALAPDDVATRLGDLRASAPEVAAVFDAELTGWKRARETACSSEPRMRHAKLQCLDATLARLEAVRRAVLLPPKGVRVDDVSGTTIDPQLCLRPEPPALAVRYSDAAITGLALQRLDPEGPYDEAADSAATKAAATDPCALFQLAMARGRSEKSARPRQSLDEAAALADQCRDDRARADAALLAFYYNINSFNESRLGEVGRRAELAVERVSQQELRARFDELSGKTALVAGNFDGALAKLDAAVAGYARMPRSELKAALRRLDIRVARNTPADVAIAKTEFAKWRPIAKALGEQTLVNQLERHAATMAWFAGDIQNGHAKLVELDEAEPEKPLGTRRVSGIVVDPAGKPVAGAVVIGGAVIVADAVANGLPLGRTRSLTRARTDARGAFTLEGLPDSGAVAAEHERLRSHPVAIADRVRLTLRPVGTVRGRVELTGVAAHEMFIVAISAERGASPMYQHLAPVAADGSFEIANVLSGKLRIGPAIRSGKGETFTLRDVVVGSKPVEGVVITPPTRRALTVLVRSTSSTPLDGAMVFVLPGNVGLQSLRDLKPLFAASQVTSATARPIIGEPPAAVAGKHLPGDLVASFTSAPVGKGMMCALGVQGDMSDPTFNERLAKQIDRLDVRCAPLAADATVATLEVPPMKRLDPEPAPQKP